LEKNQSLLLVIIPVPATLAPADAAQRHQPLQQPVNPVGQCFPARTLLFSFSRGRLNSHARRLAAYVPRLCDSRPMRHFSQEKFSKTKNQRGAFALAHALRRKFLPIFLHELSRVNHFFLLSRAAHMHARTRLLS
jgi:hypothetical protein